MKKRALGKPDFERMNLPEQFRKVKCKTVQGDTQRVLFSYLTRIKEMHTKGAGLILVGGPGVGKTSAAALVLKESRAWGFSAFFVSIWELRELVRSKVFFEETTTILDRCRTVDTLVLDDMKESDIKDHWVNEEILAELVKTRVNSKRVTVLTARTSAADFRMKFPKLFDASIGGLVLLGIEGKNLRADSHKALVADVVGGKRG